MSSNLTYSGTPGPPDKAKAMAAVIVVHALLAAIILTGLNAGRIRQAVERLTTIVIIEPPPPPPSRPPIPTRKPQAMKKSAGAPAKKAEAAPVVAPQPRLTLPSPIPAAKVAGTGAASSSGASSAGTSSGAGGNGSGPGGGYDNGGNIPARLVRNLSRGDYRSISSYGMPQGSAVLHLIVNAGGTVSSCRVLRSSGSGQVDAVICQLAATRMLFEPAEDLSGRPVAYEFDYHARWQ
ncbi:MAG: hypothetical protein ABI770_02750 [Sphingomicrobium sp.]